MSTNKSAAGAATEDDPVADLRAAAEDVERAEERVAEFGESELQRLADAHDEFVAILDRYEEEATGDGDFQQFIEFQSQVAEFVERLPEGILLRETFEEADDRLQQRRLTESDFEQVRSDLEPVGDLAARLDERAEALDRYRRARNAVRHRLAEVRERIDELDRLQRLGDADLDAPVERLRDPIETYNERIGEAFDEFTADSPARAVFAFLEAVEPFPLVAFRSPPAELHRYVQTAEAGTEPIATLLDYAEYSRSKLDHYVADPGALKSAVRPNTTYLRRLDADPLTVDWPPPAAATLRWRTQELTAAVNRIAPEVVESLRAVERLPEETDYERLRTAAVARAELTDAERDRLTSGAVADELDERQQERERLSDALAEYPDR